MDTGRSGEAAKALELVAANPPWRCRCNLSPVAQAMAMTGDLLLQLVRASLRTNGGYEQHYIRGMPRRFVRCNFRLLSRLENRTTIPRFAASVPGVFNCSFHALAGRITSAVSTSWAAFFWAGEPDSLPEH